MTASSTGGTGCWDYRLFNAGLIFANRAISRPIIIIRKRGLCIVYIRQLIGTDRHSRLSPARAARSAVEFSRPSSSSIFFDQTIFPKIPVAVGADNINCDDPGLFDTGYRDPEIWCQPVGCCRQLRRAHHRDFRFPAMGADPRAVCRGHCRRITGWKEQRCRIEGGHRIIPWLHFWNGAKTLHFRNNGLLFFPGFILNDFFIKP